MSADIETTDPIEDNDTTGSNGKVARRSAIAVAAGGLAAAAAATMARGGGPSASGAAPAPAPAPAGRPVPRQTAPSEADLGIAALAAGLEVLAVNTYGAALDAAGTGALGAVPPAVGEYVTTARAQHQAHLDAWNGVLAAAGKPTVSRPPADLEATVNAQFGMVTDIAGAAQLALWLEQVAASTYLFAISALESPDAITLAGVIYPIDRQHISILLFALGMYPVPEVFANTEMAYTGNGVPAAGTTPETK
ncbi:MAG: ferritin-like domain-containing protein [Ilumatobacteraceae bacterium]